MHGDALIINHVDDTYLKQSFQVMISVWYNRPQDGNKPAQSGASLKAAWCILPSRRHQNPGIPLQRPCNIPCNSLATPLQQVLKRLETL
jgi:hypothetical protein